MAQIRQFLMVTPLIRALSLACKELERLSSVRSSRCFGHGTHVAGIIAAQPGNIYNITGVAYKASLNAYRVIGCNGLTQD
jgi:hypothetical protein